MALLSSNFSDDSTVYTIKIDGKFDYNLVQLFRNAYENLGDETNHVVVDLEDTDYMDSSALGMLLNMKKSLERIDADVRISHCKPQIKKIFQISHFDKKFDID